MGAEGGRGGRGGGGGGGGGVMAKVVLPKSGPADHFWSPKVVRPD